jgi:hypothetical protein
MMMMMNHCLDSEAMVTGTANVQRALYKFTITGITGKCARGESSFYSAKRSVYTLQRFEFLN